MVLAAVLALALKQARGPLGPTRQLYRLLSSVPKGDRVGPDRILPANSLSTTWPDGAVEIRFSDKDPRMNAKPISVGMRMSSLWRAQGSEIYSFP